MCGISGVININNKESVERKLHVMNESMKHRGPDDQGVFFDDFVALSQTRLSIIDLSAQGHQPMMSFDKNIVVVFNGEIYNFKQIKSQISNYEFVTKTDTEVIIAAYLKWGISFIDYLDGMFAIVLYDIKQQKVFLIRDRLGVKPLYFHINSQNEVYFASEIRTIIKGSEIKPKLNLLHLNEYFTYQTITNNKTLLEGVFSVPAGSFYCYHLNTFENKTYWKANSKINSSETKKNAVKNVRELFLSAVEKRMMSDVPLGAFLSGGIDSSAVVAAMSELGITANTFNVNFDESQFSEARFAEIIAQKFKTNHTTINLKPDFFLSLLPDGVKALDHPSIDGLNTYVVSKVSKEAGITVALSGVGGDEWFAGYPFFNQFHNKSLNKYQKLPFFVRQTISKMAKLKQNVSSEKKWEFLASDLSYLGLYRAQKGVFSNAQISKLLKQSTFKPEFYDFKSISDVSIFEWEKYLMPVLLRDTDQMGMAHSLEIREPFLDYQLIEYLLSLPDEFKFGSQPKQLLVDAMGDLLPPEIVNRPKMGFVLPYQQWMKYELKPFALKGIEYLQNHNAFNSDYINQLKNWYFNDKNNVRWNMIWNLAVLGHWINNNHVE